LKSLVGGGNELRAGLQKNSSHRFTPTKSVEPKKKLKNDVSNDPSREDWRRKGKRAPHLRKRKKVKTLTAGAGRRQKPHAIARGGELGKGKLGDVRGGGANET